MVTLSRRMASADQLNTPYTNYVGTYTGALDYVFYEPGRLAVRRQIPLPPEEALQGFIPSSAFPSDHLAVRPGAECMHAGTSACCASWLQERCLSIRQRYAGLLARQHGCAPQCWLQGLRDQCGLEVALARQPWSA